MVGRMLGGRGEAPAPHRTWPSVMSIPVTWPRSPTSWLSR